MRKTNVTVLKVTKDDVFKNYTYIIGDNLTNEAVIIDPAWEINRIKDIVRIKKYSVRGILLTHSHFDHIDLANSLSREFSCDNYINRTEFETTKLFLNNANLFESDVNLQIFSVKIETIYTPGHTAGSTCYLIDDNLFTGDTLFIEGCGICIGSGADPVKMYQSLNKMKMKIPSYTKVYPGHSFGKLPGVSFGYLLNHNIYLSIDNIDNFVGFRMRKNQKSFCQFN